MDYRELLKKYMKEVIENEGVDFIPTSPASGYGGQINQEGIDTLNEISNEIIKEGN